MPSAAVGSTMWEAITYVSSAVTLVAFVAAAAVFAYRASLRRAERIISTAPEPDRVRMAERVLERFHVETGNLTKQQQYDIAMEQIHNRLEIVKIIARIIALLAVLAAVVLTISIVWEHKPPVPQPRITKFHVGPADGKWNAVLHVDDDGIPPDLRLKAEFAGDKTFANPWDTQDLVRNLKEHVLGLKAREGTKVVFVRVLAVDPNGTTQTVSDVKSSEISPPVPSREG